jgi:hypothetical protein
MKTSIRPYSKKYRPRHTQLIVSVSYWLGLFAVLILLVASAYSAYAAKPPATIFGEYVGFTDKSKSSGQYLPTKKTDKIQISRSSTADAKVTISMTFDKGQSCELEGDAVWTNGQLTVKADGLDEAKPCQLVLRINGAIVTLQDSGMYCREVYCGARGTFDKARFQKKP